MRLFFWPVWQFGGCPQWVCHLKLWQICIWKAVGFWSQFFVLVETHLPDGGREPFVHRSKQVEMEVGERGDIIPSIYGCTLIHTSDEIHGCDGILAFFLCRIPEFWLFHAWVWCWCCPVSVRSDLLLHFVDLGSQAHFELVGCLHLHKKYQG